jgi:hypothetical protein
MAQPRRAETNWQLPSQGSSALSVSHQGSGGSSTQTSESGQATPATGSASDLSDRDGPDSRDGSKGSPSHDPGHSRDYRLPVPSDKGHHDLSAAGGYGSSKSQAYELEEFHHHNVYDDDDDVENAIVDGDYGDKNGEILHGETRRNGGRNGTWGKGKSSRRLSDSTVASFQLYTPDEENAVVKKFDRKLVVFLAFCYTLSFVDRSSTFLVHVFFIFRLQPLLERVEPVMPHNPY